MRLNFKKLHQFLKARLFSNQSGIALLMVLSAITALTVAVVELKYNSQINYKLAINHKNQLQAYYLAKSAINFSQILIKYEKQAQKTKKDIKDDVGDINVEPIYKLFPLSTETLKGVFSGAFSDFLSGDSEEDTEESGEEADITTEEETSGIEAGLNSFDKESAQKFLDFEGDFYSEISEEKNKYDLNQVYRVVTSSQDYDNRKKILESILELPKFKKYFERRKMEPVEVVHALSDWVDENDVLNEYDNIQRGSEKSEYGDLDYTAKDGKFISLSELRLVHNMDDELYNLLMPFVTVFNTTEKINVCMAEEEMARAMIYHYTNHAGCANGVSYEDVEEMDNLVGEFLGACPDPTAMAKAVNDALGLKSSSSDNKSRSRRRSRRTKNNKNKIPGCKFQLEDLLTDENDIFTIKATGVVGETSVSIKVVLNASDRNASKWNLMYYKVE